MLDWIMDEFYKIIFFMMTTIAKILDVIIDFCRMLLGLPATNGSSVGSNTIYQVLSDEQVIMALVWVVIVSIILCFIFAVIRIVRGWLREEDDGAVSKAKAVKGIVTSIGSMLLIPTFVVLLIMSTTAVAQVVDNGTRGNSDEYQPSYGTQIIFSPVGPENLTEEGRTIYGESGSENLDAVMKAYEREGGGYYALTKYVNKNAYFQSFIMPFLGLCIMVFTIGMSAIIVGQRLFYIVFLYVISPITASTRPLDDGTRYKKWMEIMLGKLFSCYGVIIALNIFILVAPIVAGLEFFDNAFANGVAKLVIYISGAIAASGANQLVSQLIGSDAGTQERDQAGNTFRSLMGGMNLAKSGIRTAGKLAKWGAGKVFGGKKNNPALDTATSGTLGGAPGGATSGGEDAQQMEKARKEADNPLNGNDMAHTLGNLMLGRNEQGKEGLKNTIGL